MKLKFKSIWIVRFLTLLVLCFIAFRPIVVRPDAGLPPNWAILIDTSLSMRVKDPAPRLETAKKLASTLADEFESSQLFQFSESLRPVSKENLSALKADGKKTDIAEALSTAFADNQWRGGVIFTDGRQVGKGDILSAAGSTGKPLVLVGMGDRSLFKDIAVREIQSPPFAFKNLPTSLSATLSMVGFSGKQISVKLREGERLISLQTVLAAGDDVETTVTFQWTPGSLGSKTLTVEAGQYDGEITTANNRKDISLHIGRDRFRVLYICGEPGPEYGFLRHQFKSDPAVELVTFVILRNAQNILTVPEGELSLIPFPTQDVLISQMATFDLVVFEEFSYAQYGLLPAVMIAIRQKVMEGGSFLLMGGPVVFGPGSGYSISAISDMIPVPVGMPEVSVYPGSAQFLLKAPLHPVLRLEQNPEQNLRVWNNLPPLDGITLLPPAKPGATVLAAAKVGEKEYPVLTAWKFGKGRVATLSARTTWRWSMQRGKREQSADVYQQFWKNMVLWLTHSDEFKSVRMALESKEVHVGGSEAARIWVYDEYFKPISDADIRVQLTSPEGATSILTPRQEGTGVFTVPIRGESLGDHKLEAWVFRRGRKIGDERIRFRVTEGHSEEEDLRPDFESLRELAHITNGRFLRADEFSPDLLKEFDNEIAKETGRKMLLWNSPWLFGALVGLLLTEWLLRKRRGLP